jgi:hypothetical protein
LAHMTLSVKDLRSRRLITMCNNSVNPLYPLLPYHRRSRPLCMPWFAGVYTKLWYLYYLLILVEPGPLFHP